jgi:hypothetical protein
MNDSPIDTSKVNSNINNPPKVTIFFQ